MYHPKRMLVNSSDFMFTIDPELQQWTDTTIFTRYIQAGVKKIGFVVSKDLFASVSVEQTMDEIEAQAFQTAYFDNETEAKEWLIKN